MFINIVKQNKKRLEILCLQPLFNNLKPALLDHDKISSRKGYSFEMLFLPCCVALLIVRFNLS